MEKHIKLIMDENKSIHILVNNEEKLIISENSRSISADKIYELFNFSIEDNYKVSSENNKNIDEPVLNFFYELFDDIANKINNLVTDDGDSNIEEDDNTGFSDDIPF